MARKSSKTAKVTREVAGEAKARRSGPTTGPVGQPPQDSPGPPGGGGDLTVEELGKMTAGATRIRIKVDFADLSGPADVE